MNEAEAAYAERLMFVVDVIMGSMPYGACYDPSDRVYVLMPTWALAEHGATDGETRQ